MITAPGHRLCVFPQRKQQNADVLPCLLCISIPTARSPEEPRSPRVVSWDERPSLERTGVAGYHHTVTIIRASLPRNASRCPRRCKRGEVRRRRLCLPATLFSLNCRDTCEPIPAAASREMGLVLVLVLPRLARVDGKEKTRRWLCDSRSVSNMWQTSIDEGSV